MANKSSVAKPNLSNNNFIILALLITLVVVGVTVLVGKSLVTTIVLDTKVLAKKNTANNQLKKNLEAAPKLVDAYAQLADTKRSVNNSLPNKSDFSGLIAQVENMAGVSGVDLKSIAPDLLASSVAPVSTSEIPLPQEFKFTVSMAGSYDSLQKFLSAVENSSRPMKVNSLRVAGSGSSLTFELGLSTYYQDIATIPFKLEVVK